MQKKKKHIEQKQIRTRLVTGVRLYTDRIITPIYKLHTHVEIYTYKTRLDTDVRINATENY